MLRSGYPAAFIDGYPAAFIDGYPAAFIDLISVNRSI